MKLFLAVSADGHVFSCEDNKYMAEDLAEHYGVIYEVEVKRVGTLKREFGGSTLEWSPEEG